MFINRFCSIFILCQLVIISVRAQQNISPVTTAYLTTDLMDAAENKTRSTWIKEAFTNHPPFSFIYNESASADFLKKCTKKIKTISANKDTKNTRITWTDQSTGFQCQMDIKEFFTSAAVEWTLRFKNTGTEKTPPISNIQALDYRFKEIVSGIHQPTPAIHYSKGCNSEMDDFMYRTQTLQNDSVYRFAGARGRPTTNYLPFFNIEGKNAQGKTQGIIVATGWSGQWASSFSYSNGKEPLHILSGMENIHTTLYPGEEIRSPRILLFFWKENITTAYNKFRKFMLSHHSFKQNGLPVSVPLSCTTWGGMKEQSHFNLIDTLAKRKARYDVYWLDAGWYGPDHETEEFQNYLTEDWYTHVGDWRINHNVLPHGLKPVSDAVHRAGMKMMLWFEPERAMSHTPLAQSHKEWFITLPGKNVCLLNLGLPAARAYMVNFISNFIQENKIDVIKHDFNLDPLEYWRANDSAGRKGITEIKYVQGLYAFWDELLQQNPGLYIDNCASGGRRFELEALDRSISLSRTDYSGNASSDPIGGQINNYGLLHWITLNATINQVRPGNTYNFRSDMSAGIGFSTFDSHGTGSGLNKTPDHYPWDWHLKMTAEHIKAKPFFYGDYYPLTNCTTQTDVWMAYQLFRPDLQQGAVFAFRRQKCKEASIHVKLHGLEKNRMYTIENADNSQIITAKGALLMDKGIEVSTNDLPGSQLLFIEASPNK